MRHLIIAAALLAFAGLDVAFVEFSDTPTAALMFAFLAFVILLVLSGAAGGYAEEPEHKVALESQQPGTLEGPGSRIFRCTFRRTFLGRILLASLIPVVFLLLLAFIPDLDDPLNPSATVQLGTTFAVFWLLMSLALAGAVLGFLFPRTGTLEAVLAGGVVVLAQSLLSWAKADAGRDAIQLALYTWMVWVTICLIGAWVGFTLRRVAGLQKGMEVDQQG